VASRRLTGLTARRSLATARDIVPLAGPGRGILPPSETGQTGREGDEPTRAACLGPRSGKPPMAKGQKKSNKETRKPKAEKAKVIAAAPSFLTPLKIGKQK
jgi:hypothetical protein